MTNKVKVYIEFADGRTLTHNDKDTDGKALVERFDTWLNETFSQAGTIRAETDLSVWQKAKRNKDND